MVFKGTLYILNLLCGIIPCEHKYQFPDTTPSKLQVFNQQITTDSESKAVNLNNITWNDEENELFRDINYNETHPLVVHTSSGKIRGYWMMVVGGRKIRAFEGIPYAEPPMNERRFKAPLPVKPWGGVLHANLMGPKCLQYNDIALPRVRVVGSENCLFLNIYSPKMSQANTSTKKYPVIFYIHGDAFLTGSGNDFGPAYLLQRKIVLVTINYRLGVLGFMSTGDEESPGNAGLKDQAEAINWVYNNIESFNGDKNKITLLGHGSGAACVQFHMMSFRARGKFMAGISISGTAFNQWALHTKDQALNLTKTFAKAVQCPVHGSTKNIVACLRRQRGFDLVKMQISFLDKWPLALSLFRPVIEDQYQKEEPFLTEMPEVAYQKGIVDKIPWVCGQAEDEGYTFLLSHVALGTFGNLRKKWNSLAPDFFNYNDLPIDQDEITRRVNWLYFRHENPSTAPIKIYSDALGSRLMYTGIHKAIQAHSQNAATYAFMFGFNGKYNLATTAGIRPTEWAVGHGEVLGYILNSTNTYAGFQKNDTELVLSKILVNLMYNFADKQIPEFTTEEEEKFHVWNAVTDPKNISFLHIAKTIKMIPEPYLQQTLYWESLGLPDSLPLANFSNEIQNVSSAPQANEFVSTDITITGNTVPKNLLPPVDLNPGTFSNDNTSNFTGYTTEVYPSLTSSASPIPVSTNDAFEKYPFLTTSAPSSTTQKPEMLVKTTSTTVPTTPKPIASTSTTSKPTKPLFGRWLAQDFIPMPLHGLKLNLNATQNQQPSSTSRPTTSTKMPNFNVHDDTFPNLIDSSQYDSFDKNVPFGISVPILPTLSNTGFITKSNVGARYYLNSLGPKVMLDKSSIHPSKLKQMMTTNGMHT